MVAGEQGPDEIGASAESLLVLLHNVVGFIILRTREIRARRGTVINVAAAMQLCLAEMPQVDRVGKGFEGVVQSTDPIEAEQQMPELILPAEHALDGIEPLFEDGGIE